MDHDTETALWICSMCKFQQQYQHATLVRPRPQSHVLHRQMNYSNPPNQWNPGQAKPNYREHLLHEPQHPTDTDRQRQYLIRSATPPWISNDSSSSAATGTGEAAQRPRPNTPTTRRGETAVKPRATHGESSVRTTPTPQQLRPGSAASSTHRFSGRHGEEPRTFAPLPSTSDERRGPGRNRARWKEMITGLQILGSISRIHCGPKQLHESPNKSTDQNLTDKRQQNLLTDK